MQACHVFFNIFYTAMNSSAGGDNKLMFYFMGLGEASTTKDTVGSTPEAAVGSKCSTGSRSAATTCSAEAVDELETLQSKAIPQQPKQPECTQQEKPEKLVEERFFEEIETSLLHHQSTCPAVSFQKISTDDQKGEKSLKDKCNHEWLTDKSLALPFVP